MLKSNTKKARKNIKQYIINYCYIEGLDLEKMTEQEIAEAIAYRFRRAKLENYNCSIDEVLKHFYNNSVYAAFKDWMQGLPCGGLGCYYYNRSAKKDVMQILEETEEEANKFTEEEAEEKITSLLYSYIFRYINFMILFTDKEFKFYDKNI